MCSSPELACPGAGAAEQLPEQGKADACVAPGVWERAGISESELEITVSLLLSYCCSILSYEKDLLVLSLKLPRTSLERESGRLNYFIIPSDVMLPPNYIAFLNFPPTAVLTGPCALDPCWFLPCLVTCSSSRQRYHL